MTRTATGPAGRGAAAPGLDVSSLPPLPDVGMRILRKFGDEFIDGNEVAAVVERDPAICARLIGLANSAYFNLTRPAADMRDIVNRVLGVDTVRSLAFALATQQAFDTTRCPAFDARRYWRSALTTGDSCARIASVVDDLSEDQRGLAYVFGLCHNLGLLALACIEPERLDGVLARHVDEAEPLDEGISAEFGFDCAAATASLAQQWALPGPIQRGYDCLAAAKPADDLLATVVTAAQRASDFEHVTGDEDRVSWVSEFGIDVAEVRRACQPSERRLASIESTVNLFVD